MGSKPADYLKSNSKPQVIEALRKVIANTYSVYFKTHSYHWNVEGAIFKSAHEIFEEQYTEIWGALDDLAERLRALGAYAPANTDELMKGSEIKAATGAPAATKMCEELAEDNTKLAKIIIEAIGVADDAGDEVTMDMLIGRATLHEKYAWMLNAMSK